jgi:hypothetical protein
VSQKKVIWFAIAGIIALILGIATGRVLDTTSEQHQAGQVE